MRTLAIDLGSRRIGLALSDASGRWATPLEVLTVTSVEQAFAPILAIVQREQVQRLAVGLPLNMDDSIGPAAQLSIDFGRQLARRSGLPVIYIDERLSSFAAEQQLTDRKRSGERLTRKGKKQRLDAMAAAAFLQAYLDGQVNEVTP